MTKFHVLPPTSGGSVHSCFSTRPRIQVRRETNRKILGGKSTKASNADARGVVTEPKHSAQGPDQRAHKRMRPSLTDFLRDFDQKRFVLGLQPEWGKLFLSPSESLRTRQAHTGWTSPSGLGPSNACLIFSVRATIHSQSIEWRNYHGTSTRNRNC
jgi:hypothetical protein